MKRLDEILSFLFHSKIGRALCTCAVCAISFTAGGCMIFDGLDCMFGGSENNPSCWGECDDACNELVSCGGSCENNVLTALFGAGCEKDCGECGTWFLSCNPSEFDCGGGCSGCDDIDCSFLGCQVTTREKVVTRNVVIEYIDINTRAVVGVKEWTISSSEEKWESIPESYLVPSDGYVPCEENGDFYVNCSDVGRELSDRYADASGKIVGKTSAWDIGKLYVYCVEKFYNQQCNLTFYATVDGEDASTVEAFNDFVFPQYAAKVGVPLSGFPAVPEIAGYAFKGFYYGETQRQLENGGYFHLYEYAPNGTSALSIEMRYQRSQITVTYDGKTYENVAYDSTLQDFVTKHAIAPEASNERFAGFIVTHGNNTPYFVAKNELHTVRIRENTRIEPEFDSLVAVRYHGYYGPNDDRVFTPAETYYQNDTYTLLAKPEQDTVGLYEFAGWFKESECINQWTSSVLLDDASYDFYAKWNADLDYEIRYYRNETDATAIGIQSYEYSETNAIPLRTPAQLGLSAETGYTLAGWYDRTDPTQTVLTSLPEGTHGNIQLCLKKVPNAYEITLLAGEEGTVSPNKQTIYYGESFALPVPTRTGHDFKGWYNLEDHSRTLLTDQTGSSLSAFIPTNASATKFQFNATWEKHTYQITFVNGDGTQTVKDYDYSSKLGELNIQPTEKTGYEFVGWFSGNKEYSPTEPVTADCTYEAKYEAKAYKITFDAAGGTLSDTEATIKYGEKLDLSTYKPNRSGYEFGGWSYNGTTADFADFDGEMLASFTFTNDITVYAIWYAVS